MSGALETISGQSYGAQQYKKLGTQTYTAIFSLTLFSIPLSVIWIYMGNILVFLGQDPAISHEAGRFMTYLVPTLVCYAVYDPLVRYFQSQSLVMPMFISSCGTLLLHVPLCWALVYKSGLNNLGGAIAMGISNWLNAIFLALYMMFSPSCAATRSPISLEMFHGIGEFFPICYPLCCNALDSYQIQNLKLLFSLCGIVLYSLLTTISTLFAIPYGVSAAASTRISNELGAGNPQAARIAAYGAVAMGVANGLICSSFLFATRRVFGYCFSNEKQVIDYVTTMAPLVCVNVISDSMQVVLSGVARGCGWQRTCSYVNLAAYYLVGIPVAAALGFWNQMRGRGLWMGIMVGALTQSVLMSIITSRANWEEEAKKARKRVGEETPGVSNGV
uniref:Uncharacterized protein n=1 Tax=Chenopodium quinoa TaxID=63459 RepID=A0A803MYI2_CHEQI